jgi:hypothetical protein
LFQEMNSQQARLRLRRWRHLRRIRLDFKSKF